MVNTCPIKFLVCFSHNQFKIMQLILKNKNESNIHVDAQYFATNIKIQKFNIMYKLKLRRTDIVTGIASYFSQDISSWG